MRSHTLPRILASALILAVLACEIGTLAADLTRGRHALIFPMFAVAQAAAYGALVALAWSVDGQLAIS